MVRFSLLLVGLVRFGSRGFDLLLFGSVWFAFGSFWFALVRFVGCVELTVPGESFFREVSRTFVPERDNDR